MGVRRGGGVPPACPNNWREPGRCMCYELAMRYVIRPVASLQELAQVFDLVGAQLPQRLTRQDRRFAELARRFPADRSLMRVAQDQAWNPWLAPFFRLLDAL
jgi:hypothetical protein